MKTSVLVPLCLTLVMLCGCGGTVLKSTLTQSPSAADGNISEWSKSDFQEIDDSGFRIAASREQGQVRIAGMVTDKRLMRQIAFGGLTLWISPSAAVKKELQMDIQLNAQRPAGYYKGAFFAALTEGQKKTAAASIDSLKNGISVTDHRSGRTEYFRNPEKDKFAGVINISEPVLTFEINIPEYINNYFDSYRPLGADSYFGITILQNGFSLDTQDRPAMNGGPDYYRQRERSGKKMPEAWFRIEGGRK